MNLAAAAPAAGAMAASPLLHATGAAICAAWAALLLATGRGRAARLPAAACAAAAAWAAAVALAPGAPLEGFAGVLEVVRDAVWLGLLLSLSGHMGGPRAALLARRFALAGAVGVALALASLVPGTAGALALPTLGSPALLARLGLALLVVVLAENLYRNAGEERRWFVNLPCVALGGLAAFDVVLYTEAALSRAFSPALIDARAALTALAASLLAVAAVRGRRWRGDPPVSRHAVFHGATLVLAGTFLLGAGAVGEALRRLGAEWGASAQASVLAGAAMALAAAVSTSSLRSRVRRGLVDHFFQDRYDYRREWLRCVETLSAPDEAAPAAVRAVRAVADPVDSPAGALLLREGGHLRWAGSWNLPAEPVALPADHPLLAAMRGGTRVVELGGGGAPAAAAPEGTADPDAVFGPLWLAVPLLHHREGPLGCVLLAPPRAPLALDREVFDLLRTLGREVAMFLAERQAAERLADQRRLGDYAKRFAFVAHDVKTVSSQLTLLLANAEDNIEDPEFQRDMLTTIRASAERINTLIARLRRSDEEPPAAAAAVAAVAPAARLRAIAARCAHPVRVEEDGPRPPGLAAIPPERFDAAVTHLLDNAVEASAPGEAVRVRVRTESERVVVDIADRGPGMTPEFIRDELFRPLSTSKPRGNGIGAWQARDLLRGAGGDLTVLSRPGSGTTMRLILPRSRDPRPAAAPQGQTERA